MDRSELAKVDRSQLAKLMLRWESIKQELDEIEGYIVDSVLRIEETVEVGNVRASYSAGRKRYNYQDVGSDAPTSLVAEYTKTVEQTDWRALVMDGMQMSKDQIPFVQSDPTVTLKIR